MAEETRIAATVLECRGDPAAVASPTVPEGAVVVRLRPERALVVLCDPPVGAAPILTDVVEANPAMLVVDVSAGWVAVRLEGPAVRRLAALTPLMGSAPVGEPVAAPLGPVPAVLVPGGDAVTVLVPASYERVVLPELGPPVALPAPSTTASV